MPRAVVLPATTPVSVRTPLEKERLRSLSCLNSAVPTILFKLGIGNSVEGEEVNSISLRTQIRISATRRRYDEAEQGKLRELFGEPHQWKDTLRSVLWTNTNTIVTGFSGGAVFEMPVTRTYDIDVREFIDRLCGGDGEGISPGRLNQMLRTVMALRDISRPLRRVSAP